MSMLLLGVGAAGNKAAAKVLERKILPEENIKLLNTTYKDIPEGMKNNSNIFKFGEMGGCGKEPKKGRMGIFNAIKKKELDFDSIIGDNNKAIIVTSTEGGTGCGATPVIAKYLSELNIVVHVFAFIGFQDEVRGINNTLTFFKNLPDDIILHTIENKKFLDYSKNYYKAESLANEEFVNQLEVMLGCNRVPSEQNIDDRDHDKIISTPGYMDIHHVSLEGCKNIDATNAAIIESFDNRSCMDYENSGCKRLAVVINASQKTQEVIDNKFEVIKRYIGEPFETYRHVQYDGSEEYVDIIVSGLPYPEDDIKNTNKKYNELKNKLNTSIKSLDDIFDDLDDDFDDLDDEDTSIHHVRNSIDVLKDFSLDDTSKRKVKKTITDEY